MDQLALAFQVKVCRFSVRTGNVFPELAPVFNFLPIHGTDNIAFFESGAIRRSSESDFVEDRRRRRISEVTKELLLLGYETHPSGVLTGPLEFPPFLVHLYRLFFCDLSPPPTA